MTNSSQMRNYDIIEITDLLNTLLANYQVHKQKLLNFHWTVYGVHFYELHRKFEDLYKMAQEQVDAIAERVLVLGTRPLGTFRNYLSNSEIKEVINSLSTKEMIGEILHDYKTLLPQMRHVIEVAADKKDEGTVDLISDYLRILEKEQWMLQSFLMTEEDRVKLA
jgi:starvation-inducible DNA-binding protein